MRTSILPSRRFTRTFLLTTGLFVLTLFVFPFRGTAIRIGPDTTVLTGPLRADGTVDYVAAINEAGQAIDPSGNAAVVLAALMSGGDSESTGVWANEIYRRTVLEKLGWPEADPVLSVVDRELMDGCDWDTEWWVEPRFRTWLELNEVAIDAFRDAPASRGKMYWPVVFCRGDDFLMYADQPYLGESRFWTKVLLGRARQNMANDDWERARADLAGVVGWSRRIEPDGFTGCIDLLVGMSLRAGAIEHYESFLASAPVDEIAKLQVELAEVSGRHPLENFLEGERLAAVDGWQQFVSGRVSESTNIDDELFARDLTKVSTFDSNAGLCLLNELFDQLEAIARLGSARQRTDACIAFEDNIDVIYAKQVGTNMRTARSAAHVFLPILPGSDETLSALYIKLMLPEWTSTIRTVDQAAALWSLLPAACAQRRHFLAHGHYAEDWQTLIATGLLEAAPIDVFTDEPALLRVDESGCVIYSVSSDFDDDGGVDGLNVDYEHLDDEDRGDIVIQLGR